MGIKSSFNKFLRENAPEIFEEIHMSHFAFQKIAIDFSLYINKFKAIAGENWIKLFIRMVSGLRKNHIHCVFIYDGKSPVEKEEERKERRKNREANEKRIFDLQMALDHYNKTGEIQQILTTLYEKRRSPSSSSAAKRLLIKEKKPIEDGIVDIEWVERKIKQLEQQIYEITSDDFDLTRELFDILNVPYYTAPTEAETMCADLCKRGLVSAVLSEDTDVMAYGTPIFLSKLDNITFEKCTQIRYDFLLEALGLSDIEFLDLCIMCGTDYNSNISGIGAKTSYKFIKQFHSIENFIDNVQPKKTQDFSVLHQERGRELFRSYTQYNIDKIPFCGKPNFDLLSKFLLKHNINMNLDSMKKNFDNQDFIVIADEDADEDGSGIDDEREEEVEIEIAEDIDE